jgi:hypothetical protein
MGREKAPTLSLHLLFCFAFSLPHERGSVSPPGRQSVTARSSSPLETVSSFFARHSAYFWQTTPWAKSLSGMHEESPFPSKGGFF